MQNVEKFICFSSVYLDLLVCRMRAKSHFEKRYIHKSLVTFFIHGVGASLQEEPVLIEIGRFIHID